MTGLEIKSKRLRTTGLESSRDYLCTESSILSKVLSIQDKHDYYNIQQCKWVELVIAFVRLT